MKLFTHERAHSVFHQGETGQQEPEKGFKEEFQEET